MKNNLPIFELTLDEDSDININLSKDSYYSEYFLFFEKKTRIPRKLKKKCKRIAVKNYKTWGEGNVNPKHIRISEVDNEGFTADFKQYLNEY